jgi:predicted enzyme related to lactoylglutathione lyase
MRSDPVVEGMKTLLVPVKDVTQAKAVYGALLGVEPMADAPYYVGYQIGELQFGLVPNGHAQGLTGPVAYWDVTDIRASIADLVAAGATVTEEPKDVGYGKLVATLTDADGNPIGLSQNP